MGRTPCDWLVCHANPFPAILRASPRSPLLVLLEPGHARAVCVLVLAALFGLRAVRAFSSGIARPEPSVAGMVTNVPMQVLTVGEGEELEKELAARVAGAGKGYTRATPSQSRESPHFTLLRNRELTVHKQ